MKDISTKGHPDMTNMTHLSKMSRSQFIKLCIVLILCIGYSIQTSAQYLKADGQKIVNTNGDEVILRGIGLGGWMLQEGYMLRTGGPQHQIEAKIADLVGETKKEEFYDAWLANHCTKRDIDSMASWGYNSIRLPMHYKLFTPPIEEEPVAGQITWNEKGFDMVDDLLSWVKDNDMYLILDLHAAPGGQGENEDISDYDRTKPSLWESTANQDKMVALWKKLAERYVNEPNIGAYDIINEPNWGFQNHASDLNGCAEANNTPLWNLQKRITTAIREVDQNHLIIIEGNCWGNNYNGLPSLWDNNLAISYHKYWNSNAQSSIQGMINMRSSKNVPIWLGETGENSNAWFTDAIDLFETNKIGWSWWPLKKMGGNNPLQIEVEAGYQNILDYWSGKVAKPSESAAFTALMELAEGLKTENNTYHPDVVDAMIRQPHSDETLAYKDNSIPNTGTTKIYAVDYDLGRAGFAYNDSEYTNETGNAGGLTWNQGYAYRNDGVDIQTSNNASTNGYNVGWTDDGEWLIYTLDVESDGAYQIGINYATGANDGSFRLYVNDSDQTGVISLASSGGFQQWNTQMVDDVVLYQGKQKIKFYIEKGGFNLNYLELTLKKNLNEVSFESKSGYTSESGDKIYLSVNKIIDASSTAEASNFTLHAGETSIIPSSVTLDPDNSQRIILAIEGVINDNHELTLSYTGSNVQATDGTTLQTFEGLAITNNLPVHTSLPAKIEAEDFYFNQGLELETTTDTGGGQNLGYTNSGDYLDYHIAVSENTSFKIEARIASGGSAGKMEFQQLDATGEILNSAQIDVPVTGGWQTWKTISTNMNMTEGRGTLRVKIIQPEFNINWFRFTVATLEAEGSPSKQDLLIYPNPTRDTINLDLRNLDKKVTIKIMDLNGKTMITQNRVNTHQLVQLNLGHLMKGIYIVEVASGKQVQREKVIIE